MTTIAKPSTAYDLLVVGAGAVGLWTAVHALELGARRVVVLDAHLAGGGASSRAAGMVRTQGGTAIAVDLARYSVDFYRSQEARWGVDSGFRSLGYLILARDEDEASAARGRVAMHRANSLDSRYVDAEEAAELLPLLNTDGVVGATYCADDGAIDPERNVLAAVVALRLAGGELRERTPVVDLILRFGRVTGVRTPAGDVHADRVVLAGGAGQAALARLAGAELPVGGARHHVALTSPHPALVHDAGPMGFDVGLGLYWRSEQGGLLFGVSHPDERPGPALGVDWDVLATAQAELAALLPVTDGLGLRKVWAATIDYTPDHLPVLGLARDRTGAPVEHLSLASAAGHGMMWGPAVARIAADLALHGATEVTDVSSLGPERFDADGRSSLAADPISLPFPSTVGSA